MNIGINEQQLRDIISTAVYLQLMTPEDNEFYTYIKDLDEYLHEYINEN